MPVKKILRQRWRHLEGLFGGLSFSGHSDFTIFFITRNINSEPQTVQWWLRVILMAVELFTPEGKGGDLCPKLTPVKLYTLQATVDNAYQHLNTYIKPGQ